MRLHRRERKAGNLLVRYRRLDIDLLGQTAEPGAQDDRRLRHERASAAYHRGRGFDPIEQRRRRRHAPARSPNSAVPNRIIVAPSSTATA